MDRSWDRGKMGPQKSAGTEDDHEVCAPDLRMVGARGAMLRAYDKATGVEIGEVCVPAPQTGSPMTYMLDGSQYIVVAVSGGNHSGELLAFRLPESS